MHATSLKTTSEEDENSKSNRYNMGHVQSQKGLCGSSTVLSEPYPPVFDEALSKNIEMTRSRVNSAGTVNRTTKSLSFKRTKSYPDRMNLLFEVKNNKDDDLTSSKDSQGSVISRWKRMLIKSYTSATINKSLKGVTTSEQII